MTRTLMTTSQALGYLLDEDHVSELFTTPVRVSHLRIKPEVALIASVSHADTGNAAGWIRLLWPVSHSKAAKAHTQAQQWGQTTRSRHITPDILADWGSVDADPMLAEHVGAWRLSSSQYASNADRFDSVTSPEGMWAQAQILRYNPLRRLVVRDGARVSRIHAKAAPQRRQVMELISHSVPIPQLLDIPEETSHITSMAACGNGDLSELIAARPDKEFRLAAHRSAGELFARLHLGADVDSPEDVALLSCLPRVGADTARVSAVAHAGILEHIDTLAAQRLRALAGRLDDNYSSRTSDSASGVVVSHGDASADQILTTNTLDSMWMNDFDRVCLATPSHDLGSYQAALISDAQPTICEDTDAFLAGYGQAGGALPSEEDLRLSTVQSLISRLAEPLKAGQMNWQTLIHQRLDTIEELVQ